jgi:hypothetical protein
MSFSPRSPQHVRGGVVLLDPGTGAVARVVALQYNPASLTRSLQPQWYEPAQGDQLVNRHRLKGPPVETINMEAEIDAADQLEFPEQHQTTAQFGILPQLAALETIVYPTSAQLESNNQRQAAGTLEIVPMEAPLTIFVWSKSRIAPVRITEFSIAEEFFDTQLNPIRAKVTLGLRVLSVDDLGFRHRGSSIYMRYHQQKERLARLAQQGDFAALGIQGIPS